ncbi:MAG: bifunctional D-glycero-beta-D-manno-heptose-7-phosphate kinase/D-glycero-beta-D-manno-heptose 1-phosphate adenylyltransferase HldE [Gammaproteobacteria bacterium]|nr:bifunctional D-glycero-beta-D-manno-heptose-7-phosphate kinase/D-glycero-beta-D-manno-heptose 1-phosphate adenylyltransferase HldE [Gammaproteobacteria bacterium]
MNMTIPDFSPVHILIMGDVMLDRYWHSDVERISPEAPVPVARVAKIEDRIGGAGNAALNAASLGTQVTLLGITGQDQHARDLEALLKKAHIAHGLIKTQNKPTITKIRIMNKNQQLLRTDFEQNFQEEGQEELLSLYQSKLNTNIDVVILSDYGKGTLKNPRRFISLAKAQNIPILVDPKSPDFSNYAGCTILKPNMKEFKAAVGLIETEKDIAEKAQNIMLAYDIAHILLTRGSQGMTLLSKNEPEIHIPAQAKEVYDVSGAGDTAIAVLGAGIAVKMKLIDAVRLSNAAAGIVIGKLGTATVSIPELHYAIKENSSGGVLNEDQLMLAVNHVKALGEKIIMTNGCFDILHAGHVHYLEQAKALGDRLIVAVNSDDSVRRLKGKERPINSLARRMAVLAGLSAVDWVIPFSEDTPERLICKVLPDVLVKGGDWHPEQIAGSKCVLANGGEVKSLDFVEGHSSTAIIEKIRLRSEK